MIQMTLFTKQNRLTDIKNKLIAKGETWRGKDKSGAWDEHTIYKIGNLQEPNV